MTHSHPHGKAVSLRDAVRHKVESESLPGEQLDDLMSIQHAVLADQKHEKTGAWSLAAACLVAALGLLLIWANTATDTADYSQSIALEVVENHLKLKPLDVNAGSMSEIRQYFTQLDFRPASSKMAGERFGLVDSTLLGGRYCSIKGVTAAQLRYRQATDGLSTLYEVPYDPAVFGPAPVLDRGGSPRQLELKGLRVSLWVEKGLLMVLVEDA